MMRRNLEMLRVVDQYADKKRAAVALGISQSQLSNLIYRRRRPSEALIGRIEKLHPGQFSAAKLQSGHFNLKR